MKKLKTEIKVRGNSLRRPRDTLYPQRLALTSPTSGGRSVGIIRLRTTATEFSFHERTRVVRGCSFRIACIARPPPERERKGRERRGIQAVGVGGMYGEGRLAHPTFENKQNMLSKQCPEFELIHKELA
jgi:hypothetical protein